MLVLQQAAAVLLVHKNKFSVVIDKLTFLVFSFSRYILDSSDWPIICPFPELW